MKTKPQKVPHPDKPGVLVSRQRVWQIAAIKEGLCQLCKDPLSKNSKQYCEYHLIQQRLKNRTRVILEGRNSCPHTWLENKPDLSGADWSLSDLALAKQYHTTIGIVGGYRRRTRGKYPTAGCPKIQGFDNVDWRKSNEKIAQEMGCSPPTVRNRRKELGIPRAGILRKAKKILDRLEVLVKEH